MDPQGSWSPTPSSTLTTQNPDVMSRNGILMLLELQQLGSVLTALGSLFHACLLPLSSCSCHQASPWPPLPWAVPQWDLSCSLYVLPSASFSIFLVPIFFEYFVIYFCLSFVGAPRPACNAQGEAAQHWAEGKISSLTWRQCWAWCTPAGNKPHNVLWKKEHEGCGVERIGLWVTVFQAVGVDKLFFHMHLCMPVSFHEHHRRNHFSLRKAKSRGSRALETFLSIADQAAVQLPSTKTLQLQETLL